MSGDRCPNCGAEVGSDEDRCVACGRPVTGDTAAGPESDPDGDRSGPATGADRSPDPDAVDGRAGGESGGRRGDEPAAEAGEERSDPGDGPPERSRDDRTEKRRRPPEDRRERPPEDRGERPPEDRRDGRREEDRGGPPEDRRERPPEEPRGPPADRREESTEAPRSRLGVRLAVAVVAAVAVGLPAAVLAGAVVPRTWGLVAAWLLGTVYLSSKPIPSAALGSGLYLGGALLAVLPLVAYLPVVLGYAESPPIALGFGLGEILRGVVWAVGIPVAAVLAAVVGHLLKWRAAGKLAA